VWTRIGCSYPGRSAHAAGRVGSSERYAPTRRAPHNLLAAPGGLACSPDCLLRWRFGLDWLALRRGVLAAGRLLAPTLSVAFRGTGACPAAPSRSLVRRNRTTCRCARDQVVETHRILTFRHESFESRSSNRPAFGLVRCSSGGGIGRGVRFGNRGGSGDVVSRSIRGLGDNGQHPGFRQRFALGGGFSSLQSVLQADSPSVVVFVRSHRA